MEKQKCPELRFSEFKNYWNEIRLGDVVDNFSYGLNAQAVKYDGKHKYIRITDIDDNSRSFLQDNLTSPDIDFEKADNYILKKKDILFARTGASVGKTYLYNETDGLVYFAGFLIRGKIKDDIDEAFIFANTQTERFHKFIRLTSQRSGQPGINAKEYTSFEFYCSDFQEQVKIGEFFKSLDESIVLHEKKLVQTQNLKKAMLEKMFPKQGSQRPEIRLKGFRGDWEERQLNDISFKVLEKNSEHLYAETFTNSAQFGVISQRDFFDKDISNTNNIGGYYVVKDNDFIYNPRISNFAPVGPVKRNKLGRTGVVSPLYFVFRTHDADHQFLETYFETSVWHKFMLLNGDTGARSDRLAIKDTIFMEMPVYCPSFEEQQKIGQFFKQLDETIKLQQQQLQTVKNLKQAFLEKMFV